MAETDVDYYAVLAVPADADAAEIGRAYRRALRRLHPDTREHTRDATQPEAALGAALALLHEAFGVLGDPDRRAAYDRRSHPARPQPRRSPVPARADRRPYLTDAPGAPLRAGPVYYRPSPPSGGDR
jgi:curved DNA-binding protein CbpA